MKKKGERRPLTSGCSAGWPLLWGIVFVTCVLYCDAAPDCTVPYGNGQKLDLSSLSTTFAYIYNDTTKLTWNPCSSVSCGPNATASSSVSVCRNINGTFAPLGFLATRKAAIIDALNGVGVTYSGGVCEAAPTNTSTVDILISCSDIEVPQILGVLFNAPQCRWSIAMKAKAACLPAPPSTTTTGTTSAPSTTTGGGGTTTGGTTTSHPTTTGGGGTTTGGSTTTSTPTTTTTSGGAPSNSTGGDNNKSFGGDDDLKWIIVVSALSFVIVVLLGVIVGMWWQHRKSRSQKEFWSEFSEY